VAPAGIERRDLVFGTGQLAQSMVAQGDLEELLMTCAIGGEEQKSAAVIHPAQPTDHGALLRGPRYQSRPGPFG